MSLLCILIFLPIFIGYVKPNEGNITSIGWKEDFPTDQANINKYARMSQKTIWEISQFFQNIGLSQSESKKTGSNFDGTNEITKRTFYGKLSKFTAKAAGLMGTIGAVFSLIMTFIPSEDSPELILMRHSFTLMNERLDIIATSIDEVKSMILVETQKAAYKIHEDKIKYGSLRLAECLRRLNEVRCEDHADCIRRRIEIAASFVNDFDVRGSVESILSGSIEDGVFGEALLDLIKGSSRCSLPQINKMASGIAALILKGFIVASVRGHLAEANYDYSIDSTYLHKALFKIEKKRQEVEKSCIKNIDSWMMQDLHNHLQKISPDPEQTNSLLLPLFASKYPWSNWHLISFTSNEKPLMWPNESMFGILQGKSEKYNVQTIAWPIRNGKVNAISEKVSEMTKIFKNSGYDLNRIVDLISRNLILKDQIKALSLIKGFQISVMSFYDTNGTMKHVYTTTDGQNPSIIQSELFNNNLLIYFKHDDDPLECTKYCHGHGDCFIFPYSNQMSCRCEYEYSGDECNVTRTDIQLREDLDMLLSITLKIPTISTVKFSLEDSSMMLKASLGNISEAITSLGMIINHEFENFGSFMTNLLEWHNTLLLYKEPLQNLKYLTSVYFRICIYLPLI